MPLSRAAFSFGGHFFSPHLNSSRRWKSPNSSRLVRAPNISPETRIAGAPSTVTTVKTCFGSRFRPWGAVYLPASSFGRSSPVTLACGMPSQVSQPERSRPLNRGTPKTEAWIIRTNDENTAAPRLIGSFHHARPDDAAADLRQPRLQLREHRLVAADPDDGSAGSRELRAGPAGARGLDHLHLPGGQVVDRPPQVEVRVHELAQVR